MNGDHFTLDELRAFARGHDPEREKLLLEHCRTCSECGDNLAAMLMVTIPARARRSARTTRNVLFAAVAASVILVGALAIIFLQPPSVEDQLAALATTETLPAAVVQFHVRLSSGTPAAVGRSVPQILEGGELLAAGEYAAAVVALERQYSSHPESRLVATYLGIARYLGGDDSPEVATLLAAGVGSADTRTPASVYAQWYLGNYLLQAGRIEEAIVVLDTVVAQGDRIGEAALETLDEIKRLRTR